MSIRALKSIFDPFTQELHAVGFNARGLGIGLAVVRDVVEAHGGRVTASSAGLGHGSRFVVTLPRKSAGSTQAT
jgi:signal transduction histidine kinase